MAHERSITLEYDGKFMNFPTVIGGHSITADDVDRLFRAGKLKPLGGKVYETEEEAVDAAKKRSKSFDTGTLLTPKEKSAADHLFGEGQ